MIEIIMLILFFGSLLVSIFFVLPEKYIWKRTFKLNSKKYALSIANKAIQERRNKGIE